MVEMLHLELEPVGIFFGNTAAKCDLEASPDKRNCVVPFLLSAADALPAERTMSESVTSHSRTFASQSSPEYFLKLLIRSGSAIFIYSILSIFSFHILRMLRYILCRIRALQVSLRRLYRALPWASPFRCYPAHL